MPPADARLSGTSRPLPALLVALTVALLVARVGTGVWEAAHEAAAPAATATDRVGWVPLETATMVAAESRKPILYDFSAEWCGPCRLMATEVFSDAAAAAAINRGFVPVRVIDRQREEGHNPPEVDRLQRFFRVQGFPTLVVAWPDSSRQAEFIDGYRGRDATVAWLAEHAGAPSHHAGFSFSVTRDSTP